MFKPRQVLASELTVHGSRVSSSPPVSSWAMVALRLREAGTALIVFEARARDDCRLKAGGDASPPLALSPLLPPLDEVSNLFT